MEQVLGRVTFRQRDVVIIPVPFSDQKSVKVRPAIVVSNDKVNSRTEDLVLVPLTSVLGGSEFALRIDEASLERGRLLALSDARVDKIFTAQKVLVKRRVGTVRQEVLHAIGRKLSRLIAVAS